MMEISKYSDICNKFIEEHFLDEKPDLLYYRLFGKNANLYILRSAENNKLYIEDINGITYNETLIQQKFEDSVSFSVEKADSLTIQAPIKRLKGELATVQYLQDEGVLTILKGYPVTKDSYIEELQTHISIFQLKHQIYSRNKEISQTTDQAIIQKLKQENARGFSELKSLYQKILPEEESSQKSQLAQAVSHKMQERKNLQRKNVQQSQGKAIINTDFMRNLTNSLQRAQRANKKALMERERSDERQELEEKGHSI